MERLIIHYDDKPIYPIIISESFDDLGNAVAELNISDRKICIVTDSNVGPLYAEQIRQILERSGMAAVCFEFPAGEENKNLDTVQDLYEFLIEHHFERNDVLAALGGGVVGDLTGYVAATYLRGIRFIQIPTSLLAQVDSSIGGKTGVDFRAYKNMVGAFHQPSLVYSNSASLQTLTERQYVSGLGEIIKHGLIYDSAYYDWLIDNTDEISGRSPSVLTAMILRSDEIKQKVVEDDPTEMGERAVLNFGHTFGHAVEKLMNFSMLHGECVSIGMAAAAWLSMSMQMISTQEYHGIISALEVYDLPVKAPGIKAADIVQITKSDKKMDRGHVKFILLKGIGNAVIETGITDQQLLQAAQSITE